MKSATIFILILTVANFSSETFAEEMYWQKAVATAEVYRDKAEECKNYYKYKINTYFSGCEFLTKNFLAQEDNALTRANRWALQQADSIRDGSPEDSYRDRYMRYTLEFNEHIEYINLNK